MISAEDAERDDRHLSQRRWTRASHQHDDPVELQAAVHRRLVAVQGPALDRAPYDAQVPLDDAEARRAEGSTTVPEGFKLHPRVEKVIADRRAMGEGKLPLDWGMGETLAYATLLNDGYGVRHLRRGRRPRHVRAPARGAARPEPREVGLGHVDAARSTSRTASRTFEIIDSVLTENAVLGFEYGYTTSDPNALVIWEAQFGDFANGAQVVIDQFISVGRSRSGAASAAWSCCCRTATKGRAPSTRRRGPSATCSFAREHNMQVCVPSTPAQIFHLLRRQMLRPYRKPLIVMSPKSLLRHKEAVSSLEGSRRRAVPER